MVVFEGSAPNLASDDEIIVGKNGKRINLDDNTINKPFVFTDIQYPMHWITRHQRCKGGHASWFALSRSCFSYWSFQEEEEEAKEEKKLNPGHS